MMQAANLAFMLKQIRDLPLKDRDRVEKFLSWLRPDALPGLRAILQEARGDWRRAAIRRRIRELEAEGKKEPLARRKM